MISIDSECCLFILFKYYYPEITIISLYMFQTFFLKIYNYLAIMYADAFLIILQRVVIHILCNFTFSYNRMSQRSPHISIFICIYAYFINLNGCTVFPYYVYVLFMQSLLDVLMNCFHFFSIPSNTAVNFLIYFVQCASISM